MGDDLMLSKTMVGFWVDFIISGDPNLISDIWSPSEEDHMYMNISGLNPSIDSSTTLDERMALWEENEQQGNN